MRRRVDIIFVDFWIASAIRRDPAIYNPTSCSVQNRLMIAMIYR